MKSLYQMIGISKQGHYKRVSGQKQLARQHSEVVAGALALRSVHKRMGCRKIYHELNPVGMGRDKTEALLLSSGLRLNIRRNYHRTTYGGRRRYPNLISGLELSGVNQLWVSDTTYIPLRDSKPFYLTLIMDVYSRKIKGWSLSATLLASDTVVVAYKQALRCLDDRESKVRLIFHSDRGSQYTCRAMEELHIRYHVSPSMGGKAWENAHAESLNGVLKHEYIAFDNLSLNLREGRVRLQEIITKYNTSRPHGSLKNMKPAEYETFVETLKPEEKPKFTINY